MWRAWEARFEPQRYAAGWCQGAWICAQCVIMVATVLGPSARLWASETLFEARIRPALVAHCYECHGGNDAAGDLRVDSRRRLVEGGSSGPAIEPGDAEGSLLVRAIRRTDTDLQMPPDHALAVNVVHDFIAWIDQGARWPDETGLDDLGQEHWAYLPVSDVEPPALAGAAEWNAHPIDRFVSAQHQRHALRPVPMADARTLVRRLYFDLLGMPPTPQQMGDALRRLQPWSDREWKRLIDRLLDSPHYGERWGRHWLDVARYADTAGDNADYPIPEAYQYRNYVIDSFNADKPYNEFLREQLAGDLLARDGSREQYASRVIATGFLALSRRYATGPYELWHLTLEDTIDTVGQAMLGLTLRCARCHDHKFDPIPQQDYYALYGIFASTQFPWAGAEEFHSQKTPRLNFAPLLPPSESATLRAAYEQQQLAAARPGAPSLAEPGSVATDSRNEASVRGYPDQVPSTYGVQEGTPHDARLQHDGDPSRLGDVVPRGPPAFLVSIQDHDFAGARIATARVAARESGRRELADWITRPDNPLTARVMANRIWQHLFGRGIVSTPSNFGVGGARPTHPGLLDWLAREFVSRGWSVKQLQRLILTSRAYRLASLGDTANIATDPDNTYVWRQSRRRLDAEAIRDSFLVITGTLDATRDSQHPFPPISTWTFTQHNQFRDFYPSQHRSVYLMTPRLQRHPFLALFDGPDTNVTTGRRSSSIVPSQTLYLMNNPQVRRLAAAFADRFSSFDRAAAVQAAYQWALQRDPIPQETAEATKFLQSYAAVVGDGAARQAFCHALLISNEVFYVD